MINCPLMRNEWVLVVGDDDAGQDKYSTEKLIVTYSTLWVTLSLSVCGPWMALIDLINYCYYCDHHLSKN